MVRILATLVRADAGQARVAGFDVVSGRAPRCYERPRVRVRHAFARGYSPRRSPFEKRSRAATGHSGVDRAHRDSCRPGRAAFTDDELAQTAVVRWVEIIGEAARGLTEELRRAHPEVPWRQMVAMRNVLIHGCFDIDVDLVWSVAVNDLPKLAVRIRGLLEEIS